MHLSKFFVGWASASMFAKVDFRHLAKPYGPSPADDDEADQLRDALLLKLRKMPPQSRPKRDRDQAKPKLVGVESPRRLS